jgi:4-alpha-glucanotransferase
MNFPRAGGIILHPTSLPGRFGIGDLGDEAYAFVDFLKEAGQTYWQILPLSPTGYGDSPYQGLSAFAGNPMLISPRKLVEVGHLAEIDLEDVPVFPKDRVDFGPTIEFKTGMLKRAFSNFQKHASPQEQQNLIHFCEEQASWLDDFALYMAVKESYDLQPWSQWDGEVMKREPGVLDNLRSTLSEEIENHKYLQWQFFEQWSAIKEYANDKGIQIFGDIPIFVSMDSADVWANPHLFLFDDELQPLAVSGVPPDFFSETGQLWGHPLYRWDVMAEDGYAWWISRFRVALSQVDVIRIDHFRGFYNYWEVPAGEDTAIKGHWLSGPGAHFLRTVTDALGAMPIIAEDLGDFDKISRAGVDALMEEFSYPGMKILQFAFSLDSTDPFLPHNFTKDWVVYTGTHDNDTINGWLQESSSELEREHGLKYMGVDGSDIAWDMIRLAWSSVANTAITPAQDLLNLDSSARMNIPSTTGAPNWCWRLKAGALTSEISARLLELTNMYGRLSAADDAATES